MATQTHKNGFAAHIRFGGRRADVLLTALDLKQGSDQPEVKNRRDPGKPARVTVRCEQRLGRHAGMLAIVAGHCAAADRRLPQMRIAEDLSRPSSGKPLARQPQRVTSCRSEYHACHQRCLIEGC